MDNDSRLTLLNTRREYVFREIQILYDLSKLISTDVSKLGSFKSRYKRIESIRSEFVDVTNDINQLILTINPQTTIDYKKVESFDSLYYSVVATADEMSQQIQGFKPAAVIEAASQKQCPQVRLPQIELPKFDGNIEIWQTFYDTYLSLIHKNTSLSTIEKYHYLLSCLSGSALSIVKSIPVTTDNYQIVFNALIERYENKRILAVNYLDKICNFIPLKTCSFSELQKLTNLLLESVNALKAIKIENLGEFILFYLASKKLDSETRERFESENFKVGNIPEFKDLMTFLLNYIKILEASGHKKSNFLQKPFSKQGVKPKTNNYYHKSSSFPIESELCSETGPQSGTGPYLGDENCDQDDECDNDTEPDLNTGVYSATNKLPDCLCCGYSHHSIYKCPVFHGMSHKDKEIFIQRKNICVNCLRINHSANSCFSKTNCAKCNARHHTLLHKEVIGCPNVSITAKHMSDTEPLATVNSANASVHITHSQSQVILGTCLVQVRGPNGIFRIRALIDSGAQDCFMTSACAQRLGLPLRRCRITVAGLGQNTVHQVKGVTSCVIYPCASKEPRFEISPIVMNVITNKMPTAEIPAHVRNSFNHLILADNKFDAPAEIDLLLGAELFHNIYDGQRLVLGPGLPVALHSIFGWVITGKLDISSRPPSTTSSLFASTLALDNVVKRFWEVEEPPVVRITNPDDVKCENMYAELVKQKPDGRYVVPILLKESHEELGNSQQMSLSRLYNLEKRLLRHEQLKLDYVKFMQEYSELEHMTTVSSSPSISGNIIPHHCVIRPESSSTKLRVVFDASAKTANGISLNDIVYTGPKLQNDIVDIITSMRLNSVVFTADISKMYRNIELRPEDRKYQHILWRDSIQDPISEFELNTVTYGVSSSPYLAIRTLHQLADDHGAKWPRAAEILRRDTFMDDIVATAPTVNAALEIKEELINLLNCGKFELRKWSSNSAKFLSHLPSHHCQTPKIFCDRDNQCTLKILGIQWDPANDKFTYSLSEINPACTKRIVLSNVARIYDPLGWLTPVVLVAKMFIQELWRLQLDWDEPVSSEMLHKWQDFVQELRNLSKVNIPRQVISPGATRFELVGFCDGSTKAYGCCIYLITLGKSPASHLLIAKSRVAPTKPVTVNRLELLGAALLSRVLKHMYQLLSSKIKVVQVTAFTDSSVVLAWLNTAPHKLKTFVAHRVVKISDEIGHENWKHVATHDNPADYCSRGLRCLQIVADKFWWTGPAWLVADKRSWPVQTDVNPPDIIPELKPAASHTYYTESRLVAGDVIDELFERYSSLSCTQRVLAWCFRFINNLRKKKDNRITKNNLTSAEIEDSLVALILHEQNRHFAEVIESLRINSACSKTIHKLNPFVDEAGLLRVGGRLRNALLPSSAIHPFLLPKHSHLSTKIIDYYHRLYLHCGPRALQSLVQRKFWILGIRNLIRSKLSKCVTCFKVNPVPSQPIMGNLPIPRVQPARCFQNIGIDFAGPFTIKESRRRNARTYKVYVCVMVCLAVKAVHLEAVTDLSTPAFVAALDRFVSRRGLCKLVVSDCGRNFIGAKRYLCETQSFLLENQLALETDFTKRGIEWRLNPPTGSHFGGIFESGVKSMKHHLKRVIGLQVLTFEEFTTVLAKIEAVLNSRPLCSNSPDPGEVDVLTPGHFLTGGPLVALPEPILEDVYLPPRERWQLLQQLAQRFWRVWTLEYLHTLQQRNKWFRDRPNVKIGDIVTIVEQNLPPLEWRYGRIVELHPGTDGVVRVVSLRTANGIFRRPVAKICPLPIN